MTDFGADEALATAAAKLKEHYGMEVPVSAVRGFTEAPGAAMLAQEPAKGNGPDRSGLPVLIAERDGSMLPVVETAETGAQEAPIDRRKTRQVGWKEARLALAHPPGSVTPIFGATLGSVAAAGERLRSAPWRLERETRPRSTGWAMGRLGLLSRWRRSLGVKPNI